MKKYYEISLMSLPDNIWYKHNVICTKVPFSNKKFKQIITDRIIEQYNPSTGLIYDGNSWEIEAEAVETWLQSMSEDKQKLQMYVETIQIIEKENLKYFEEMKKRAQEKPTKQKSTGKSIKRTLRKIKQRQFKGNANHVFAFFLFI